MDSNFKEIYIGRIIQAKVNERGMSYAEFARSIHCARTSLYHLFESKSIDVERLLLICEVLDYDFISEVYCHNKSCDFSDSPFIQLPIKDHQIDLSQLPPHLLTWIKEQLK